MKKPEAQGQDWQDDNAKNNRQAYHSCFHQKTKVIPTAILLASENCSTLSEAQAMITKEPIVRKLLLSLKQ